MGKEKLNRKIHTLQCSANLLQADNNITRRNPIFAFAVFCARELWPAKVSQKELDFLLRVLRCEFQRLVFLLQFQNMIHGAANRAKIFAIVNTIFALGETRKQSQTKEKRVPEKRFGNMG